MLSGGDGVQLMPADPPTTQGLRSVAESLVDHELSHHSGNKTKEPSAPKGLSEPWAEYREQIQTNKKQPRRVAERRVLKKIPKSAGTLRKNANLDNVSWKEVAELTEVPFEKEPDPIPVRENLLKPIPIPLLPVPVTEYKVQRC